MTLRLPVSSWAFRFLRGVFGVGAALFGALASAHTLVEPGGGASGSAVSLADLIVTGGLILVAATMFGLGVGRLRRRALASERAGPSPPSAVLSGVTERDPRRALRAATLRAASFYTGLAILALALLSPLDLWAAESFAAHMIQHELLMLGAAPLLVLGRPLPMFLWSFPTAPRHVIARFFQRKGIRGTWSILHGAGCAWVLHALALWVWHVPYFFNAALSDRFTHDLQHLTFLATALLFWSALFDARRSAQQGAGIVYLFTTTIHTGVLGALITLASRPWYAEFLQPSGRWSLSPLEDQQLGGLIMWVPGAIVYVGAALVMFARWVAASESGSANRYDSSRNQLGLARGQKHI